MKETKVIPACIYSCKYGFRRAMVTKKLGLKNTFEMSSTRSHSSCKKIKGQGSGHVRSFQGRVHQKDEHRELWSMGHASCRLPNGYSNSTDFVGDNNAHLITTPFNIFSSLVARHQ